MVNLDRNKIEIIQKNLTKKLSQELKILSNEINFVFDEQFEMIVDTKIRELRNFSIITQYPGNLYTFERLFLDTISSICLMYYKKINNNRKIEELEKNRKLISDILNIL